MAELEAEAVQAADDQFYAAHPELVRGGQRTPIGPSLPNHDTLADEWRRYYEKAAASTRSGGGASWQTTEPYLNWPTAEHGVVAIRTTMRAHGFLARSARLVVKGDWPLAGYYVYMDTDPTEQVDFDSYGLLWTDESGKLHFTDGDGKPVRPVTHFVFAWSTDGRPKAASVVLIYDEDLGRLKKRKSEVERASKYSSLLEQYGLKQLKILYNEDSGAYFTATITVPRDDEVIPLAKLEALMARCEQALKNARAKRQEILDFVNRNEEHIVLYFYRQEVNNWLNEPGSERRSNLIMIGNRSRWDMECVNFDRDLEALTKAYEAALDPLYEILSDEATRRDIGRIGLIVEGWANPDGEHLLWRHQFLAEAWGMFSGTWRQQAVFDNYVRPLFENLSLPWSTFRSQCKCRACVSMQDGKTAFGDAPADNPLDHIGWKSRDLKMPVSTLLRTLDLFTKFLPNWAHAVASSPSGVRVRAGTFFGWWLFIRGGLVGPGSANPQVADRWLKLLTDFAGAAKNAEDELAPWARRIDEFLKTAVERHANAITKIGSVLNVLGAGIVIFSVLTKEGTANAKDAMDVARAISDVGRAGAGLSKQRLEAVLAAKLGEKAGKKWAAALPRWLCVAGNAFQLVSATMTLQAAAEKGDKREFWWGMVQVAGADVALAGAVLDVMPEPVVTKGSGIALNFIGGVVYLTGQVGEFFTRPGAEELYLINHHYYKN